MPSVCETLSSSVKHDKPSVKIIIRHTIMGNTVLTVVHRIMFSVFLLLLFCFVLFFYTVVSLLRERVVQKLIRPNLGIVVVKK